MNVEKDERGWVKAGDSHRHHGQSERGEWKHYTDSKYGNNDHCSDQTSWTKNYRKT